MLWTYPHQYPVSKTFAHKQLQVLFQLPKPVSLLDLALLLMCDKLAHECGLAVVASYILDEFICTRG